MPITARLPLDLEQRADRLMAALKAAPAGLVSEDLKREADAVRAELVSFAVLRAVKGAVKAPMTLRRGAPSERTFYGRPVP